MKMCIGLRLGTPNILLFIDDTKGTKWKTFFILRDNQETVCKLDGIFFVQSLGQGVFFYREI